MAEGRRIGRMSKRMEGRKERRRMGKREKMNERQKSLLSLTTYA
jgi:hypothetical protein